MGLRAFLFFTLFLVLTLGSLQVALAEPKTNNTAGNALEAVQDWRSVLPTATATADGPAMVQVRNSRVTLADNIHFQVDTLQGTLQTAAANSPVTLDDYSAFDVSVKYAKLRLTDAVVQTLVQAELQASNAPLRIKQVNTLPSGIQITGDIKRLGLWIPFTMEGTPTVANAREITLTPRILKVAGVPVYKALLATNIQLQSLIDMKSNAVALQGQSMVLRLDQLLRAPRIAFELHALQLGQGEVQLALGTNEQSTDFFCTVHCPNSFVYTVGGKLRAAGMVLSGKPTLITGVARGKLPIALHNLNKLISTSTIQLRPDGAIWISAQEGELIPAEAALLDAGEKTIAQLKSLIGNETTLPSVTLAVHHSTLISREGIEMHIEKLLASTDTTDLGQLPTAAQTVHVGEIILGETALNTMMNKALFNFSGSPIRQVKSKVGAPFLVLDLQVRPEIFEVPLLWLPARLRGELKISTDQLHLEFTPSQIRMFGVSVLPLLGYVGLNLESLIKIDQPSVKLQANTIRIALNNALPPLQLNTRLQAVKPVMRSPQGPYIHVHVGTQPTEKIGEIYNTMERLPLGLWMNTPEFTALGMRTGPTLGHVYHFPRNERLRIDLANYPGLLGNATLRVPKPERVWVSMPGASQYPVQSHGHKNEAHQVPHHHQ